MRFFSSNWKNKLDGKGRVSIPAAFRKVLEAEAQPGVVLIPEMRDMPCVDGMGAAHFERMVDQLEAMPPLGEDTYALQISVVAEARQVQLDDTGRIVLSADLQHAMGLKGDHVVFAGLGRTFQIWDPETYEEMKPRARQVARQNFGKMQAPPPPRPEAG
jgi:MraZ protein